MSSALNGDEPIARKVLDSHNSVVIDIMNEADEQKESGKPGVAAITPVSKRRHRPASRMSRSESRLWWQNHMSENSYVGLVLLGSVGVACLVTLAIYVLDRSVNYGGCLMGINHCPLDSPALVDPSPWISSAILVAAAFGTGAFLGFAPAKIRDAVQGGGLINTRVSITNGHAIPASVIPLRIVLATVVVAGGFPMGLEGPAVHIAAATASAALVICPFLKKEIARNRDLQSAVQVIAAATGVAAAFDTPIAGVTFALEELLELTSRRVMTQICLASVVSTLLARMLLHRFEPFRIDHILNLDIHGQREEVYFVIYAAIVGIFTFLGGLLFTFATLRMNKVFFELDKRLRVLLGLRPRKNTEAVSWATMDFGDDSLGDDHSPYLLIVPYALFGVVGALLSCLTYTVTDYHMEVYGLGTHGLEEQLKDPIDSHGLGEPIMMFVYRILMASMATSVGVPAGLLTPALVTGGYLGSAVGSVATSIAEATNMSPSFAQYLHQTGVLFGMTGMFSSWFRTPITAVVIAYELTGVYSLVLPIMLCNYLSSALTGLVYRMDVTEHMMERAGVRAEGAHFELTDVRHLFKSRLEAIEYDYHAEHPSLRMTDHEGSRRLDGSSRMLDWTSRGPSLSRTMMKIITPNIDITGHTGGDSPALSPQRGHEEHASRISGRSVRWVGLAAAGGTEDALDNDQFSPRPSGTGVENHVLTSTVILRDSERDESTGD
ncbi:hypothetical protein FOZ62_021058 [Perkinsus olseni]|uniref:Chloride Channel n=3 Tax=Perkinsus olseni TaxID=32597 RepID=A0A7J6T568_PEROL|nr:hypothetical protein FOZ62_021058 [Perkinsus olseni]